MGGGKLALLGAIEACSAQDARAAGWEPQLPLGLSAEWK